MAKNVLGTDLQPCSLDPLTADLAPEVWARLRRAAKRDVIAANLRRAITAVGGLPRGELAVLVGGCAERIGRRDHDALADAAQVLGLGVQIYDPVVHYHQVRDSWVGVRTPDGK